MKILLSAFACEPGEGSELGVGWGVAASLAHRHRVHVLTTPRHRAAIDRFLEAHPRPQLTFSYLDFSARILQMAAINSASWQIYYYFWQLRIGEWARPIADEFDPDIVHHVTYARYWTPNTLWRLRRPFVWGPLGGGDDCPPAFFSELTWRERVSERVRSFAQWLAHLDPHLRETARHASASLGSTAGTIQRLRALGSPNAIALLANALETEFFDRSEFEPTDATSTTFCSVGRLLGWKGHSLALRAFAAADLPDATFLFIGDGPSKAALQELARTLGVDDRVAFLGAIPREEALQRLQHATALVHPSLHDQAPTVVFEAMALSRPVIALALGGLPLQITPATGFLIPAENPSQSIAAIASAMRRIARDRPLARAMGKAGREHVATFFTWEKKAREFEEIYRSLLADNVPKAQEQAAVPAS